MQVEEIFVWEKNERKTGEFRYSMTITIRLVVIKEYESVLDAV